MNTSTSPFNQAEDRRGIFQPHRLGLQCSRQLAIRGLLARVRHGLHAVAEALRRGLGYFAESDLRLRHRRALPAVLPGIPPQWHGRGRCAGSPGAYYLNYKTDELRTDHPAGLHHIRRRPFPYGDGLALLNLQTSSPSVFGQLEYDFNDHWTGVLPARATRVTRSSYILNYSCNVCGPPNPNAPPGGYPYAVTYSTAAGYPQAEHTYHIPTGKVELDYKIDHDNLLYASVNRGAKGGGWSAPSSGYVNLNPAYTYLPVLNLNYNEETADQLRERLQVHLLGRQGAGQRRRSSTTTTRTIRASSSTSPPRSSRTSTRG